MKREKHKLRALSLILVLTLVFVGETSLSLFSYAKNTSEPALNLLNAESTDGQTLPEEAISEEGDTPREKSLDTEKDDSSLENGAMDGSSEITSDEEAVEENDESSSTTEEANDAITTEAEEKKQMLKAEAPVRKVSTVWFDGTLGLGTGNSLVSGATNVSANTDSNGFITLPTSAGNNSKYSLNGWYDINSKKWYAPGERVQVSDNTVFYADWIKRSYDLTQNGTLAAGQANTSSFVTTDVFDYNELINTYHGAVLSNSSVTSYSHSETWRDTGGNSFLFMNWYNQNVHGYGSLGAANNLTNGRNAFVSGLGVTKNIITSESDQILTDLFDTEDGLGKTYLGNGNNLFLYDESGTTESRGFGTGYYYYDSDYNGADYNQSEQRFYVYNNRQFIQGQNRGFGGGWTNGQRRPGFMPFEQGTVNEKTGQTDYWFGMKTSVDFFLPDDVGSNGGNCNKSQAEKDMRFYFSGDDDVWVFVDDQLVLDLGGIHERCAGDINFSTGEIKYYTIGDNGSENLLSVDRDTLKSISAGNHKLKIYYLERGSTWSNCSIYFNLVPRYDLKIVKSDSDNQAVLLPGAEFTIYLDEACTVPAMLYDNKDCTGTARSVFTTNDQGVIQCYGMYANRTYYLKETSSPAAYPSVSEKVISLKLDANGNASLFNTDESFAVVTQNGSTTVDMSVRNTKPVETSIEVEKKWYNEDGSPLTDNIPDGVQVQLYRSETATVPHGGGSSGASIPVRITTQYFGRSNGTNIENAPLTAGDLSKNLIVVSGGSLHIDIDILKKTGENIYQAGIYSVTVNGRRLEPTSVSGASNQECYIGGRWGQYPPIHAEYDIDNITSETNINVTLIGYLNYQSSTPLVSKTLTIGTSVTAPPAPEPEDPGIPEVKPEDAIPIGDPVTLDNSNQWHYIWENLPVTNEDGTVTYYYYVEELPVPGYSTSYTGNGTVGGTVTVSNVRLREIIVNKIWKNASGVVMDSGMPESIDAVLIQKDKTTGTTREIQFVLNTGNGWIQRWRSDDSALGEVEGHEYEYTVKELSAVEGYETPVYENNDGILEGSITITNQKTLYLLPDTGGNGTYIYCFIGGFLIAMAVLLLLRDQKGRSKNHRRRKNGAGAVIVILSLMIIGVSTFSQNVSAEALNSDLPDIDDKQSLFLTIEYVYNGEKIVSGVEFEICKVADLTVNNRTAKYSFADVFKDFGSFPDQLTAGASADLAKSLYKTIKEKGISTLTGNTDTNGQVRFTGLSPGMYLVAQVSEKEDSGKNYWSDPFLASVPQAVIGDSSGVTEWRYDVVAQPKPVNMKDDVPQFPEPPPEPNKNVNVKTGDTSGFIAAGLLLLISSAALTVVIILRQRRRCLEQNR